MVKCQYKMCVCVYVHVYYTHMSQPDNIFRSKNVIYEDGCLRDVAPCSLVEIDWLITQITEAVSTSEMSVSVYETTQLIITESHLCTRRRENLKSHHAVM
jgi:hypothetical protein